MRAKKLNGLPYVDCKTYKKWQRSGFQVKKGEKAKINGVVWMHPLITNKNGDKIEDPDTLFPKVYKLFHKSQVEKIN